jgi:diguanylate cyclase (GGDEF)-like protein
MTLVLLFCGDLSPAVAPPSPTKRSLRGGGTFPERPPVDEECEACTPVSAFHALLIGVNARPAQLRLLVLSLILTCASMLAAGAAGAAELLQGGVEVEGLAERQVVFTGRFSVTTNEQPRAILRLLPTRGRWPAAPQVLQVRGSGMQWITLRAPSGERVRSRLINRHPAAGLGHGDVAFRLDTLPQDRQPLLLEVDAREVIPSPIEVRLIDPSTYQREDAAWLAYASATLAVMLAMAMMALAFAGYLRDSTFVWYSGYLIAYVWILALQTGYLAAPLQLQFGAEGSPSSGRWTTIAAVVLAAPFLDRFANLVRYAPRLRWVLLGLGLCMLISGSLGLTPVPELRSVGRLLINPLLILGGPMLLLVALWSGLAGSRYGWIFALGWAPLLTVTVVSSLQVFGLFVGWDWSNEAALGAGAFEALVLSVGLAHRSSDLRRDRDRVQRLADVDPLTGLLNRRAWSQRVETLGKRTPTVPLSVVFIDVDRFKALNDALGHEAGDAVLVQLAQLLRRELRDRDVLARHGGEELLVALPGSTEANARETAERLRTGVERHFRAVAVGVLAGGLTISLGVAERRQGEALVQLIRRADAAMYAAKAAGRNRVCVASQQAPRG